MILRADNGVRGLLVDLATGRLIRRAKWADTETGEYLAERIGPDDQPVVIDGKIQTYRGKTQLRFIPAKPLSTPKPKQKVVTKHRRLRLPLFDCRCEKCERVAVWMTSDEVEIAPVVRAGFRYARARQLAQHFWCDFHYSPPKLFDSKGELISTWNDNGARPE